MLKDIFKQATEKFNEIKDEAVKFKSKPFHEAALAGSALIAMADGEVSKEEKLKMNAFISQHELLSMYDSTDTIKLFKQFVELIELDEDIGSAKCYETLRKMKGKDKESRLILRIVIAIARADGSFDRDEQEVAKKVAIEMDLDPKNFELT